MEVFISVVGQKMRIGTNCRTFVEGSSNFIKLTFILPDEWVELEKKAQFIQGGQAYDVVLDDNNSVFLPEKIHGGKCELILRGTSETVTAITDSIILNIKSTNYMVDGKELDV